MLPFMYRYLRHSLSICEWMQEWMMQEWMILWLSVCLDMEACTC